MKYNSINRALDLLRTFSEVTAASKCYPLARIEKQAML